MIKEIQDIVAQMLPTDLMTSDEVFCQLNDRLVLASSTQRIELAGVYVDQVHFRRVSGNEYVPITALTKAFGRLGTVVTEYRGRGTNEEPKLVFEITLDDGRAVQVVFHFGD